MKFKPSILKIYSIVFLIGCICYTILNYGQLSEGEGWGVVSMVGLLVFGILLYVGDIVIHNIFKNVITVNIIGCVIAVLATLLLFYEGLFSQ